MVRWAEVRRYRLLIACFALLSLSLSGQPAVAAAMAPAAPAADAKQLIAAFEAICLTQFGDTEGQIATGAAAPWLFKPDGAPEQGVTYYRNGAMMLSIRPGDQRSCAVTGKVLPAEDLESVRASVRAALELGEGQTEPGSDSCIWLIASDGDNQRYAIGLKLSGKTGANVATLLLQKL